MLKKTKRVKKKQRRGFTLVELLAVIVILAIILAIAVLTISSLIQDAKERAFSANAKMVIKAIDYKLLQDSSFDVTTLTTANAGSILGIETKNMSGLTVKLVDGKPYVSITGTEQWDGLLASGTFDSITVGTPPTSTPESCFTFDAGTQKITGYDGYSCTTDVVIPSTIGGVTVTAIGDFAFQPSYSPTAEPKLTSVVIPSSVTMIGRSAFRDNNLANLTIPSSVKTITSHAFAVNKLTNLIIPSSVTLIGNAAFNQNLLPDDQAFIYKRNADGSVDNTRLISYGGAKQAEVVIPSNVTTIADGAFYGNGLTSVIIPSSVTTIENYGFYASMLRCETCNNFITFESSTVNIGATGNDMDLPVAAYNAGGAGTYVYDWFARTWVKQS